MVAKTKIVLAALIAALASPAFANDPDTNGAPSSCETQAPLYLTTRVHLIEQRNVWFGVHRNSQSGHGAVVQALGN
jgi:hypothetical protein